jgi:hypothetical protein
MKTIEHDPGLPSINGARRPPFIHALASRKTLAWVLLAAVMFYLLAMLASKVHTEMALSHTPRQENDCCTLSLFWKGQWHLRGGVWHCDQATSCTLRNSPFSFKSLLP